MSKYYVSVRYWRDRTYGNTYHTVRVTGDEVDIVLPFAYGHGTLTALYRAGEALGIDTASLDWEERRQIFGSIDEVTVTRKKDLHNGGRH